MHPCRISWRRLPCCRHSLCCVRTPTAIWVLATLSCLPSWRLSTAQLAGSLLTRMSSANLVGGENSGYHSSYLRSSFLHGLGNRSTSSCTRGAPRPDVPSLAFNGTESAAARPCTFWSRCRWCPLRLWALNIVSDLSSDDISGIDWSFTWEDDDGCEGEVGVWRQACQPAHCGGKSHDASLRISRLQQN